MVASYRTDTQPKKTTKKRRGIVSEHYDALVRRLQSNGTSWSDTPRTIGITSCGRGEGVSTISANIATGAANVSSGQVLLVDANPSHPAVRRLFRVARSGHGFLNALAGEANAFDCIVESRIVQLSLMLPGRLTERRKPAYDPESIEELLDSLKHVFQLIVFDLPPADERTTCCALASKLDGVLLVIESRRVHPETARYAVQQLERVHANVLGTVLNKRRDKGI